MTATLKKINEITCLLELGSWTIQSLETELIIPSHKLKTPSQRVAYIANKLIGTPFKFESEDLILPNQWLRVRFNFFDCVTFIYTVLALAISKNFTEYMYNLAKIRYHVPTDTFIVLDNHPETGNIFDYVYESILKNALSRNILTDITANLIKIDHLIDISVMLKPLARKKNIDPNTLIIAPKYEKAYLAKWTFIPTFLLDQINVELIESGDLLLFSKGDIDPAGNPYPSLISHLAIVIKEGTDLYFIHASKNFIINANDQKNDPIKQQIGVNYGLQFAGDKYTQKLHNNTYFGYHKNKKVLLTEYAKNNFKGVVFLRLN